MAAENALRCASLIDPSLGFNEAAANGRGKRACGGSAAPAQKRFNEAAANGRGKQRPGMQSSFRLLLLQ